MLPQWENTLPPVELDDKNYCHVLTKKGLEAGWYHRDLTRGKRKGWKEIYVCLLGTDEYENTVYRWRRRICKPSSFKLTPRFPTRMNTTMKLALHGKNKRTKEKNMKIVNEEMGLFYCNKYNDWKRIDGDS